MSESRPQPDPDAAGVMGHRAMPTLAKALESRVREQGTGYRHGVA